MKVALIIFGILLFVYVFYKMKLYKILFDILEAILEALT